MKRMLIIAFFVIINQSVFSQVVKTESGISISSMKTNYIDILNANLVQYSFLLGYDYLEHKYFYLSSGFGIIKLGGKEQNASYGNNPFEFSESWNYFHVNTTFRLRYPIRNAFIYIGAGPKVDLLVESNKFHDSFFQNIPCGLEKISFGGNIETGFCTNFNRLQVGVNIKYLLNLRKKIGYISSGDLERNAFLFSITLGYRIK